MSSMNKNSKSTDPTAKKKLDKFTLIIYGILGIFLVYFCASFGTALDLSASKSGQVNMQSLSDNLPKTLMSPNLVSQYLQKGGYAPKFLLFSVVGIGVYALWKYSETRKKLHRKGIEHGSAKFADEKEGKELADSGESTKTPQTLPMKNSQGKRIYDENGEFVCAETDNNIILTKQVKMSLNTFQHRENLNILVVGGSGSGKTRFFCKPNLMQLNTSYVITDPKGEILQSTGKMLMQAGYEVKVFNLIEMAHSSNYNPFNYVYDYDGNLDENAVTKMIDTLMKNTKGDGEKDDFWSLSAGKLLTAVVFLLFEESEYNAKFDENGRIIPSTRDFSHLNLSSVAEKLRRISYPSANQKDGFFLETMEERESAFLSLLDKDFLELEKRKKIKSPDSTDDNECLASRYYKEFRIAPPETGQSILATANARTQMFNLKAVADLTCTDTIGLETLGDRKTALFVIISATDSTFNFLAAMLYTQLFDTLANRANFKYGGVLPVHVRCIMDEFANCGSIPDFEKVIAFVRSMGMSLNVIIQNMAQLKSRYEKTWEVITGNCDSLLFLGGKEESTLKYVSEALGKETIDVEAKNRTKGHRSNSTSESNSILGRELMTPDELSKMDIGKCILMIRAHNPFFCDKYALEKHPNFRFLEDFDKANAFDKLSIKTKTLSEFALENKAKSNAKTVENGNTNYISSKLSSVTANEKCAVKLSAVTVPVEYESYAEIAEFASNSSDDEVEEVFFAKPIPLEFMDTGEPIYGKEVSENDENYENGENSEGISLAFEEYTEEQSYDEECYGTPAEFSENMDVDEEFAKSVETAVHPNEVNVSSSAVRIGLYDVDKLGMEFM